MLKKSQFFQLEFLAIAAIPRLKKSSHLHKFYLKLKNAANTNTEMINSSHQPHLKFSCDF